MMLSNQPPLIESKCTGRLTPWKYIISLELDIIKETRAAEKVGLFAAGEYHVFSIDRLCMQA